ncbi:hypothetical protein D3C87_2037150 [compost metagenome]
MLKIILLMLELTNSPRKRKNPGMQTSLVVFRDLFIKILHRNPGALLIGIGKQYRELVTAIPH